MLLKPFLRWWWLMLIPPALTGAWVAATYTPPATGYTLSLTVTASAVTPLGPSNYDPAYYRYLTSEYLAGGLRDWVTTSSFAEAVSADLRTQGIDLPPAAVRGALGAEFVRSVCRVSVSGGDPAQVQAIGDSVTRVMPARFAATLPQLAHQTIHVQILDQSAVSPVPPSLRQQTDPLVRVGLALILGVALGWAAFFFDPRIHDRSDLSLPVLADIPRQRL